MKKLNNSGSTRKEDDTIDTTLDPCQFSLDSIIKYV